MKQSLPHPSEDPNVRVETGAVRFGSDWPGYFIRGDNAMYISFCIRAIDQALEEGRITMPQKERVYWASISSHGSAIEKEVPMEKWRKPDAATE